jgi:transcriptional regulator with XRE-family HTH domain
MQNKVSDFGKKLKVMRELHQFTQEQLADKLNIEQKTYSNLENGKTQLTLERANQIAEIYDMSLIDFLGFNEKLIIKQIINNEIISSSPVTINKNHVSFEEYQALKEKVNNLEIKLDTLLSVFRSKYE